MLLGNKELFAIEVMSEIELQSPSAVWGRMCVWCEGESIGDYEEPFCALYPAYRGFKHLESVLPRLWRVELEKLNDIELWNHFDGLLYGYHGSVELQDVRSFEQCHYDTQKWGDHDFLTQWGEQFNNNGKSFILCKPPGVVCVLNQGFSSEKGLWRHMPLMAVLEVVQQFIAWFKSESVRLGTPINASESAP